MSDKLGFTFYPKDWWSSDSFFDLTAIQRYIYLECLFLMYSNGGYMKTQKTQLEKRIRELIPDDDWQIVTTKFIEDTNGYTHASVNKRCRQAAANRENGKLGGRPPKDEKPKKPILETQNNPPLEREREREDNLNISNPETPVSGSGLPPEINDKSETVNWAKLIEQFNTITGKNSRVVPEKAKRQTRALLKAGYSKQDLLDAILNCFNDPYHISENHRHLTIEFITRPDKIEKYISLKKP